MIRLCVIVLSLWALGSEAMAGTERYAVLIAHNKGAKDEATLRYAESDAQKMRDVLVDLGDFRPENVTLLAGEDTTTVRRSLIAINDRLRSESSQTMLLVYYSGHADAEALHLGDSRLATRELEQLVRGSSAEVRILILDSCRSGSLTRVKGGRRAPAFAIQLEGSLLASGSVLLTSSASNEDSQESDRLKGSFFTHYLISGLLGSADENGDGKVVLSEAYRHAYDSTLRASSQTIAGTQHPTFKYSLKGKGDIVLTRPGMAAGRASLNLPAGMSYLIMRDTSEGMVEAEILAGDQRRKISLRPGRYFLRGRGRDYLVEGNIDLLVGENKMVRNASLERTDYARLVRKGGAEILDRVDGPELGTSIRSSLSNSRGLCVGLTLGYSAELPYLDLGARAHACRATFVNGELAARVDEIGIDVRMGRAWDIPLVTLAPYLQIGVSNLQQQFETPGVAPTRNTLAVHLDAGLATRFDIRGGVYFLLDVAAQNYLFQTQGRSSVTNVAVRGILALGWRWSVH